MRNRLKKVYQYRSLSWAGTLEIYNEYATYTQILLAKLANLCNAIFEY